MRVVSYNGKKLQAAADGEQTISGNAVSFKAALPDANYKIFLWDKNQIPLIMAVHVE